MLKLIIFIFMFASAGLIGSQLIPYLTNKFHRVQRKKVSQAETQLEEIFVLLPTKKLFLYYTLSPVILAAVAFFLFNKVIFVLIGLAAGFMVPELVIKRLETIRKQKFQNQLVDGLMTLSSALRGGLSLLQAMEVLTEEMPPPLNQEFSLVLRENKVGIPLEESLHRLNKRMQLDELELMVSSILVSRETGGDLTKVFSRLANTMRDKRKLKDQITTLTLQGKIQGVVMSILPIAFILWVLSTNKHHFDIMLSSDIGRMLLLAAAFLQAAGIFLIAKFSKIDF